MNDYFIIILIRWMRQVRQALGYKCLVEVLLGGFGCLNGANQFASEGDTFDGNRPTTSPLALTNIFFKTSIGHPHQNQSTFDRASLRLLPLTACFSSMGKVTLYLFEQKSVFLPGFLALGPKLIAWHTHNNETSIFVLFIQ